MGEMIKMVVVLTILSVISGGGLKGLEEWAKPKIENNVMNLVKGPAIRGILSAADNDPVEDRFKITDGDQERNIFVGVFGGNGRHRRGGSQLPTAMATRSAWWWRSTWRTKPCAASAVTTHKETPGLGARAKDDPSFAAQFAGQSISSPFGVTTDGGQISALSGATITSRAVCSGVNQAVETYNRLKPQLEEKIKGMGK
jgi:electron transport complex protein RnfG